MGRLIHGYGSRTEETLQSTSGRIYEIRTSRIWHVEHGHTVGEKDTVIQRKGVHIFHLLFIPGRHQWTEGGLEALDSQAIRYDRRG
jgi:hypothetical protein